MAPVRRRGVTAAALLAPLLVAAAGCGPVAEREPGVLRTGFDSLDGTLRVWPPRGDLARSDDAAAAVTEAVRDWRSPVDDRVHLPSSGILWSGEVDGSPLALVAASVPGESASWLLQLARDGQRWNVERATEYTNPGYLVYSDVLPVQTPDGRRYLTSERVERLLGPDGRALADAEGLTEPVDVPACRAVPLTVTLRATESLPRGRAADRLLDLGTGTTDPRYPLVRDESSSGRRALQGLDTCLLAGEDGPFGSIPRRIGDRDAPHSVPASWPMAGLSVKTLGEVALGGGEPAELQQLSWDTADGTMSAVLYRPADGAAAVFSPADRTTPLQVYDLPVPGQPLVVLTWRAAKDSTLSAPPGTLRLVDRPGLVVVPRPERSETFSLAAAEKTHYRSAGGS
ncbi:hypothetical protein GA0070616_4218 [Micromonospora nigra]|uniref:Lipoprotein LpqB beta-propeller domain-containing protein n=1 Tax=Micromonospora nigra TaxID=145857 RepID=A0A1C6SNR7_9ACTN|nr:hypothetical protein [Micromonospora nigra]SCL31191.1 hypothetical protein GA0070616_4218 [Micromonospora nigra]